MIVRRLAPLLFVFVTAFALPAAAEGVQAASTVADSFGVIPTRVIYPGETIPADALKMAKIRKDRTSRIVIAMKPEELAGKVAQRTLLANRFVPVTYVRDAYVVEAGKPVYAELLEGPLRITISAVTLEAGSTGDVVKVRNPDSGKVFSATVMSDGTVRVAAR